MSYFEIAILGALAFIILGLGAILEKLGSLGGTLARIESNTDRDLD